MKNLFLFLLVTAIMMTSLASASITSINYPSNNDIITFSHNIPLNITSSASTNCVFSYGTSTGEVPVNQSISCNGVSSVQMPTASGLYNITVADDGGSAITQNLTISKPSGILITGIYILSFFILLGMLFIFINNLAKFAMLDVTVYNVAMSLTFYFGLLIAMQLNLEYANVPFIIDWLSLIQTIGGWLMVVFPLIAFFVSMTKKGFDKKTTLSPQEVTGRGRFLNG